MTKEQRAKSKGPITPEGEEKSARNAIEHGLRAEKLKHFAPPHCVALCNVSDHLKTYFFERRADWEGINP